MADYRLIEGGGVIRLSDGASIPSDPENRDWCEYLEHLEAGGEVLPELEQPELEQPELEQPEPEPTPEELELAELRHAAKEKIAAAADLTPAEVDAVLGSNGDPVPGA